MRLARFLLAGAALVLLGTSTGGVYVTSLPSDADVWIDGSYIGRSPIYIDLLERGRHTLTITKTGWLSQELHFEVPSSGVTMESVRLLASVRPNASRALGAYTIRKLPAGVSVTVDGESVKPDAHDVQISPGVHHIAITGPKLSSSQPFVVFPGMTTELAMLDAAQENAPPAVLALASDYLPDGSFNVDTRGALTIHFKGHEVVGRIDVAVLRFDGVTVSYDGPPEMIAGQLYLPVTLIEKLTGQTAKPKPGAP